MQIPLAQIQFSAEQVELARRWILEPLFIPLLLWGYKTLKKKINLFITDNVNRIRDELKEHLDQKIAEHESVELRYFREMQKDFDDKHRENKKSFDRLGVEGK